MAGSYEHIKRSTKPTDNTAESYGGLDTSLVENMGDAIEAMVHMWWMIYLLAGGDMAKIKAASGPAGDIEVGKVPPPTGRITMGPADTDDCLICHPLPQAETSVKCQHRFEKFSNGVISCQDCGEPQDSQANRGGVK